MEVSETSRESGRYGGTSPKLLKITTRRRGGKGEASFRARDRYRVQFRTDDTNFNGYDREQTKRFVRFHASSGRCLKSII